MDIKLSRQPGQSFFLDAPSNYIIVNDDSLHSLEEKSLVILFDWDTFVGRILKSNETIQKQFLEAKDNILNKLKITRGSEATSTDKYAEFLNKEINNSLLDFNVKLRTTLGGNSCSFTIENFDNQWIVDDLNNIFYGQSIIQEGLKFTIDVKGRFDNNTLYRIWTGYVTSVSETDNPTEKKLSFSSMDNSRWLSYTRYNVHPALFESHLLAKQKDYTVFSTVLQNKDGGKIVEAISQFYKYDAKGKIVQDKTDRIELVPEIWESAFLDTEDSVKILKNKQGKETKTVIDTGILKPTANYNFHYKYPKTEVSYFYKDFKPKRLIWGTTGTVYQELFKISTLFLSEYKSKKDIIVDVANLTHYVAYIDGAGNLHYHPPRFEREHYLNYPFEETAGSVKDGQISQEPKLEDPNIYMLTEDETISSSYTQNENEVVTVALAQAQGDLGLLEKIQQKMPNSTRATVVWPDGVNRFGYREATISTAAVSVPMSLDVYAAAFLLRRNQERFQMTAKMPLRPELQVDRPIYSKTKNMIYHIREVNHSYSSGGPNAGGSWETNITCYAGRRPTDNITSNIFASSQIYKNERDPKGNLKSTAVDEFMKKAKSSVYIVDLRSADSYLNDQKKYKESLDKKNKQNENKTGK